MNGSGHSVEPDEIDPEDCEDLSCGCFHCTLEHIDKLPAFIETAADKDGRATFSFNLPEGVTKKADQVYEAVECLEDINRLRRNASIQPWVILSPVGLQEVADDPEYDAACEEARRAHEAAEEYAGILPNGKLTKKYPRSKYAEEMDELRWAIFHTEKYRLPNESLYKRSTPEEIAEHLKTVHAEHEKVIAELSEIEKALGRPVSDSVRKGALGVNQEGHRLYERGFLAGEKRRAEIVANSVAADERASVTAQKRADIWHDLCARQMNGSGWPEGTLNAPTREEWRELSMQE